MPIRVTGWPPFLIGIAPESLIGISPESQSASPRNPDRHGPEYALKNTRIAEGKNLQIRFEFLNAMNHPNFIAPNTTTTSSLFATAIGTQNYPRNVQLTAKFVF